jgi:DNA-binding CsgD family transcriptional regulator
MDEANEPFIEAAAIAEQICDSLGVWISRGGRSDGLTGPLESLLPSPPSLDQLLTTRALALRLLDVASARSGRKNGEIVSQGPRPWPAAAALIIRALSLADVAAFIVNALGEVIDMTPEAGRLTLERHLAEIVANRLHIHGKGANAALADTIRTATLSDQTSPPGSIILHDRRASYFATALIARLPDLAGRAVPVCALVVIRPLMLSRDDLTGLGLTPGEMEVARDLAAGRSLGDIAALRGKSRETVRTQSKAVYAKLSVRGQTELITRYGSNISSNTAAWIFSRKS